MDCKSLLFDLDHYSQVVRYFSNENKTSTIAKMVIIISKYYCHNSKDNTLYEYSLGTVFVKELVYAVIGHEKKTKKVILAATAEF